jgi:hypothetical protein
MLANDRCVDLSVFSLRERELYGKILLSAHRLRVKRGSERMFDVGHTSSGMTFDLRCSIRLRLRSWGA